MIFFVVKPEASEDTQILRDLIARICKNAKPGAIHFMSEREWELYQEHVKNIDIDYGNEILNELNKLRDDISAPQS